jgi:predicted ATPase
VIRRVVLRNFKRFDQVTFDIPGHLVLAGPNNTGKTTLLQALAAWHHALSQWRQGGSHQRYRGGVLRRHAIGRSDFSAVPVRALDMLWHNRSHAATMEVAVTHTSGWTVAMEFLWDTSEQMFVRPTAGTTDDDLAAATVNPVFVPATSGVMREEPLHQDPYVALILGQARPGEVLRNILVRASTKGEVWTKLAQIVRDLFGYELQAPNATGPYIRAEYAQVAGGPTFDIASAGSGFQQVLLLFAMLHERAGALLLIDEPDAHLHVILQEVVWSRLRRLAAETGSQLIVATHAETFIDAVEPRELCLCYTTPRLLSDTAERDRLTASLRSLTNTDLMLVGTAMGVLYTDDYTDREILRAWARALGHPIAKLLEQGIMWHPRSKDVALGAPGVTSKQHFDALRLVRADLKAVDLLDGDARGTATPPGAQANGLMRLRWVRYEIESYLFHPAALERFVAHVLGMDAGATAFAPHRDAMRAWITDNLPPAVAREPLGDHDYLKSTKARTALIPPILEAGGLPSFPYTRYSEIAERMHPDEIHPEVAAILVAILGALS